MSYVQLQTLAIAIIIVLLGIAFGYWLGSILR